MLKTPQIEVNQKSGKKIKITKNREKKSENQEKNLEIRNIRILILVRKKNWKIRNVGTYGSLAIAEWTLWIHKKH